MIDHVTNLSFFDLLLIAIGVWFLFPLWLSITTKIISMAWARGQFLALKRINKEIVDGIKKKSN